MTFNVYSIYDKDAEEWSPVFEQKNDATCKRLFEAHPLGDSFELYQVATHNTENGAITVEVNRRLVKFGIEESDEK